MIKIKARDANPIFGAEISGFDPHAPLDAETCRTLRALFDRRGVLVFRDLDIDHAGQVRLSQMLIRKDQTGEGAPDRAAEDGTGDRMPEDKFYVSNKRPASAAPYGRLRFHSDTMWWHKPNEVVSLYAVEVHQPAVPTIFVSTAHAWATLPADLSARVEGLSATHTAAQISRGMEKGDVLVSLIKQPPSTTRPIGYRHPRTGETILYVCEQMTEKVVGLAPDESEHLLEELFAHLYNPACRWEHHWRNGDLVIWDNLTIQHARPEVRSDGPPRTLRKVAIPLPVLSEDQKPTHRAAG